MLYYQTIQYNQTFRYYSDIIIEEVDLFGSTP